MNLEDRIGRARAWAQSGLGDAREALNDYILMVHPYEVGDIRVRIECMESAFKKILEELERVK